VSHAEGLVRAYIGLGSNLDRPRSQVKQAIIALAGLPETRVVQDAGYYVSRPMGPEDQPDYINTVVQIETRLSPQQLLDACLRIEHQQGRIRTRHWGERSIDLDILLYGDQRIETDTLTIPHPGITQRDFVYLPLLAIDDTISLPGRGRLRAIIEHERTEDADFACRFDAPIDRD